MSLRVLQRGQRISTDSRPQPGQVGGVVVMAPPYAIPRTWAMMPPNRKAIPSELAMSPTV
jgi:hypothetical protein